jgi:restriction system protein
VAEITRQRTGELLRKLFEILKQAPEGLPAKDAMAQLEHSVKLSPYEAGIYESGGRRFDKIVRFATVDCVKAGWMQKTKGRWFLTDAGRTAYESWLGFFRQVGKWNDCYIFPR